jgi:TolB-like protein
VLRSALIFGCAKGEFLMKRIVFGCFFTLLAMANFGQVTEPMGIIVSDIDVRSKDVSLDEAITVTEMLIVVLASKPTMKVIERNILEKTITELEFRSDNWSDSAKTAQLGQALNADFLVRGTITQLGTSITFTVTVRDIKTLAVLASPQRQYTAENVWDNSKGIPAELSYFSNNIVQGINTVVAQRQKEQEAARAVEARRQAEEAERQRAEAYKRRGESISIVHCSWGPASYVTERCYLRFKDDGTFTAVKDHNPNSGRDRNNQTYDYQYSGTYTRNGYNIYLSGTRTSTINSHNNRGAKTGSYPGPSQSYTGTCEINLTSGNSPMHIRWELEEGGITLFER